jgi:hypothetical protein
MNKNYLRLAVCSVAVLAFASVAVAELEAVKTKAGTLEIGGVFQASFDYYIGSEQYQRNWADLDGDGQVAADGSEGNIAYAMDRASDMEFHIRRAQVILKGTIIDDHVGYFFQTGLDDETDLTVLDMRLAFSYVKYTTFSLGRFLPRFTYWTPMSVAHLYLIDYPQMNTFLGVQRQTGFNISFFHKYFEADLALYNGRTEPNPSLNPADRASAALGANTADAWGDENTAKDMMVSVAMKPTDGLRIFGGYWHGTPLDYFEVDGGERTEHNATVGIINAGAAYLTHYGLRLWGEWMSQNVAYDSATSFDADTDRPDDSYEYSAMSYYLMGGFNFKNQGVPLEILARYDYLDPDTENDDDTHPGSDKDIITHITAGLNYYIQSNEAMLSFNYIYKTEEYELLDKKLDGEQTGIANDVIKLQAQLAF